MFTEEQLSIVKAVATILYQGCENENAEKRLLQWKREQYDSEELYGAVSVQDKDGDDICDLYIRNLNSSWYIAVNIRSYDEFGEPIDEKEIGLIRIDPQRFCWEFSDYVDCVSKFLEHRI